MKGLTGFNSVSDPMYLTMRIVTFLANIGPLTCIDRNCDVIHHKVVPQLLSTLQEGVITLYFESSPAYHFTCTILNSKPDIQNKQSS